MNSLKIRCLKVILWLLVLILPPVVFGQSDKKLPVQDKKFLYQNSDLEVIGRKVVRNITERKFGWRYPKVCTYYGSLIFANAIHDTTICIQLQDKYKPYLAGKRKIHSGHVDYNVFGIWPFEMYRQIVDKKYLEIAKHLADDEYKIVREDGLASYTRFWVDDMYMVGSLQVQAYKSLKDTIYLNRAALQLVAYCDKLQRTNGLFFHRNDAPFYWGRGNGWAAAAMAEVLSVLTEENKYYQPLLKAYQKMMSALLGFQGKDGMWHQLLDDTESFAETSCTGMFLFAMATGIEKGWLPKNEYVGPVQKSWNALAGYVNENGAVTNVCVGTNAKNSKKHYLTRPRSTGNFHGQAAVLWAASAMVRLQNEKP